MTRPSTQASSVESVRAGALAGIVGSVVQVAVGLLIDKLLLPPQHDNNIAPRLFTRLFQKQGEPPHRLRDWTLGTLFHLGYGVGWGTAFGLARSRLRVPSPLLTGLLGVLIYLVAFSRVGAGTKTGTERHPRYRDPRKQLSLIAVVVTYVVTMAASHDRLVHRSQR